MALPNNPNAVEIRDIPQPVIDAVRESAGFFFAPLCVIDPTKKFLKPVGSGTYVQIGGDPCILTAAHVWDKVSKSELLSVGLSDRPHAFFIPVDKIHALPISEGGEWGPDMALLRLPPAEAADISARRSFLNLDLQSRLREADGDPEEHDLLMVFGNVAEFSGLEVDNKNRISTLKMGCQALFSVRAELHEHGDHDYIDIGADRTLNGVPQDFGGVSGGGLWRLVLRRSAQTGEISWDGRRRLVGLAYWQIIQSDERAIVRSHGPKSLYGVAYPQWKQ